LRIILAVRWTLRRPLAAQIQIVGSAPVFNHLAIFDANNLNRSDGRLLAAWRDA
jgi:hypothetical protein